MAMALAAAYAGNAPPTSVRRDAIVLTPSEAQAVEEFEQRLEDYVTLHRKLEKALPRLSKRATPEQVDENQRALAALIRTARASAKPGEFFTPDVQALVKRILETAIGGPGGGSVRGAILDENPGVPTLAVNERYPDAVPLSTMPSVVLRSLPKLEEGLEYRFIGERLILMDTHAHIVLDFTDEVLP